MNDDQEKRVCAKCYWPYTIKVMTEEDREEELKKVLDYVFEEPEPEKEIIRTGADDLINLEQEEKLKLPFFESIQQKPNMTIWQVNLYQIIIFVMGLFMGWVLWRN